MKCPFNEENTLSDIIDNSDDAIELSLKIDEFKGGLTADQLEAFNKIDDMFMQTMVRVQHDTIKKLYCPKCSSRNEKCQ